MSTFHSTPKGSPSAPVAAAIPEDFPPGSAILGSLSGAQPKLALVEVNGRFYAEGQTPQEVQQQYELCEDLAHQGAAYCQRKLAEGVVDSPAAALERLFLGLRAKDWCSAEQKIWIVRRVSSLQGWAVPASIPELIKQQRSLADSTKKRDEEK